MSTSTLKSNRIIVRTLAQTHGRGWCKKKECWIKYALYIVWACQTLLSLDNISDKLYNIVTGNLLLQSKSVLQLQFIDAQMKAQFITKFTDRFCNIIWNFMKSLEVMLTAGLVWQMELTPIFQYKLCATYHILVNMGAFARGQNLHSNYKLGVVQQWSPPHLPDMLK